MRISTDAFQEFVSETEASSDQLALAAATNRLVEAIGYRWCSYRSIDEQSSLIVSTYPAALSDHCLSVAFRDVDPIVNTARQQRVPFYWEIPDSEVSLDPRAAQFFAAAASFRIKSGLPYHCETAWSPRPFLRFRPTKSLGRIIPKQSNSKIS